MKAYFHGLLTGAAIAAAAVAIAMPRGTAAQDRLVQGAGDAGATDEKQRWTTEKGNAMSHSLRRILVKVPKDYGALVSTSGGDGRQVLWFQGASGEMRNVVLNDGKALYQVELE